MARRTKDIKITGGRDDGKVFRVTELSSDAAEWWAVRALQALAANGIDIDDIKEGFSDAMQVALKQKGKKAVISEYHAPLAKLATGGLNALAKIPPESAKPLFDDMMKTVSIVLPDNTDRPMCTADVIEDIQTRLKLRKAFAEVHFGFFMDGIL